MENFDLGNALSKDLEAGKITLEEDRDTIEEVNTDGHTDYATPAINWPQPDKDMFFGLAADTVRAIEPHTEADPVALLIQFLMAFGNVIGRSPYFEVEADRHYTNLFAVLVGKTAKGRKGSSWGHIIRLFQSTDPDWVGDRIQSGLSSGEGLIWAVRDPISKTEPIKKDKRVVDYQDVIVDQGISDKRLLVLEAEFASTLRVY